MNMLPVGCLLFNGLMRPAPPLRFGESARPCAWLGRVRVGDDCMLRLQTVGPAPSGLSWSGLTWPDAAPVVRIYADVASPTAQLLPVDDTSGGSVGTFRGPYTPDAVHPPGHYFALSGYAVGGRARAHLAPFEVIPGGHPGGSVLSMFHFNLPAGDVFLAHQQSGRVTTGLRPYLDEGI